MVPHDLYRHVEITDGQRTVAVADVIIMLEAGQIARASLRTEAGHIPPGIRTSLVDAVLDLPEVRSSARLEATVPLGDSESLRRLRERCQDVTTHPAGATAILDARIPVGGAPGPAGFGLPVIVRSGPGPG
jgi:hypothetical protein